MFMGTSFMHKEYVFMNISKYGELEVRRECDLNDCVIASESFYITIVPEFWSVNV